MLNLNKIKSIKFRLLPELALKFSSKIYAGWVFIKKFKLNLLKICENIKNL